MASTFTVHLRGNTIANTSLRARLDPDGPGFSGTFTVLGGDSVEHSASADGSTPTTVTAGSTSAAITGHRYLRSLGKSQIRTDSCRVEGVVL